MGVRIREKEKGSGVWWLFINYKGKRTSRQIGTKKAAEKAMEHAQTRLKLGQDALPKEKPAVPTLEAYWKGLEETYLRSGIRESTIDSYRRNFKKHILPEIGAIRLDVLTRERIKAFVATLTQKRYSRPVTHSELAAPYVAAMVRLAYAALPKAHRCEICSQSTIRLCFVIRGKGCIES